MTQEDKELLLQDLCARLPWGVKVQYNNKIYSIDYVSAEYEEVKLDILDNYTVGISDIKPYLRPMSSMTEEETKEYHKILITSQDCSFENSESATTMVNDWLLSKHFDVRGLILKGLAIEVTEDNNPYKE